MKRQFGPIFAVLVVLCAPVVWAQQTLYTDSPLSNPSDPAQAGAQQSGSGNPNDSGTLQSGVGPVNQNGSIQYGMGDPSQSGSVDQSQSGSDDSSQTSTNGPQATFRHPEELPPLNMLGETVAHTGVKFNLSTGTIESYLSGYANNQSYWQNLGIVGAGINIVQIRPTSSWSLGYSGGVSVSTSTAASAYTTLNQIGNFRGIWKLANRWQLRVKDNYLYSDNPFQPYLTYASDPTPADPNPIFYFPLTVMQQNLGTADLTYQLGPHDSINFSGAASFQRYYRNPAASQWDSTTYGGGAFYQHFVNSQLSVGGGYNFNALDFGHGQSRAGVTMFQGFVSYRISPGMSFSAWVGPELTNTKDIVPVLCTPQGCFVKIEHNSYLDVAEGGNFSWTDGRNGVRVTFSHRVTNGGGVLGAVSLYQANLNYERALSRIWAFHAGILYANNTSISNYRADQYLDANQASVGVSRRLGDAWYGSMYYSLIHQSQNYYGAPGTYITSGIGIMLRYSWGHSLGR